MKVIGRKKERSPEENLYRLEQLVREAESLRPRRTRGAVIMRFKTWDELHQFSLTRAARRQ